MEKIIELENKKDREITKKYLKMIKEINKSYSKKK